MPSTYGPITLGELIDALESTYRNPLPESFSGYADKERCIYFDWCHLRPAGLHSYRGFYNHLAVGIGLDGAVKTKDFLTLCKRAVGDTFTGYKGGEFRMSRDTPIWVSEPGDNSGFGIRGVKDDGYIIVLLTEHFDT